MTRTDDGSYTNYPCARAKALRGSRHGTATLDVNLMTIITWVLRSQYDCATPERGLVFTTDVNRGTVKAAYIAKSIAQLAKTAHSRCCSTTKSVEEDLLHNLKGDG